MRVSKFREEITVAELQRHVTHVLEANMHIFTDSAN